MKITEWARKHPKVLTGLVMGLFAAFGGMLYGAKPAYDDYTERSELTGCIVEASGVKAAFAEYLLVHEKPPESLHDLQLESSTGSGNLDEIVVRRTGFDIRCNENAQYVTVRYTYKLGDNLLHWECELPKGTQARCF
jgi:hypothetical protein